MLEVFVAPGCEGCDHARALAQQAVAAYGAARVSVVDISQSARSLPPEVFAVPSFRFNGVVVSLGNPTWERLSGLLAGTEPV